ncbi:MAG TPA: hypothetical protein VIK40_05715 [Geomonas sp.]
MLAAKVRHRNRNKKLLAHPMKFSCDGRLGFRHELVKPFQLFVSHKSIKEEVTQPVFGMAGTAK